MKKCIYMTESFCYTVEIKTTLYITYTSLEQILKERRQNPQRGCPQVNTEQASLPTTPLHKEHAKRTGELGRDSTPSRSPLIPGKIQGWSSPAPPQALTLLVYLAMSAATSAEAVAMGRSALTEDARVLMVPELVTRGDDWVLVTRVMVEVDGLCVISFCWTAGKAKVLGHPTASGRLSQLKAVVGAGPNPRHSSFSAFKGQRSSRQPNSSEAPPSPFSAGPPPGSNKD